MAVNHKQTEINGSYEIVIFREWLNDSSCW